MIGSSFPNQSTPVASYTQPGITFDTSNLPLELAAVFGQILANRHPLEQQMPIGSYVKPKISKTALAKIMQDAGSSIHEALGIAEILLNNPNEVIGINDLTDEQGIVRPYVTIMDYTGCAYPLRYDYLEVLP